MGSPKVEKMSKIISKLIQDDAIGSVLTSEDIWDILAQCTEEQRRYQSRQKVGDTIWQLIEET